MEALTEFCKWLNDGGCKTDGPGITCLEFKRLKSLKKFSKLKCFNLLTTRVFSKNCPAKTRKELLRQEGLKICRGKKNRLIHISGSVEYICTVRGE